MRSNFTAFGSLAFTTLLAIPAHADEASAPAAPAPPIFGLLDHAGDASHLRAEVGDVFSISGGGDSVLRGSLLGQYVAPSGFGGYLGFGLATEPVVDDPRSVGSLEGGFIYHRAVAPRVDLGIRGGIIAPTANEASANLIGTLMTRPADLATAVPDITWLRLGISPRFHQGVLAAGFDVGADIPVIHDDRLGDVSPIWHFNAGAGIALPRFSATAELQSISADGNELTIGALSVRRRGKISPYLIVSAPLSDGLFGEALSVTGGITLSP